MISRTDFSYIDRTLENRVTRFQSAKYPMQLVILSTLVDLATVHRSARDRIKKWKSPGTSCGYLELMCEIWRREQVRFGFIGPSKGKTSFPEVYF